MVHDSPRMSHKWEKMKFLQNFFFRIYKVQFSDNFDPQRLTYYTYFESFRTGLGHKVRLLEIYTARFTQLTQRKH